MHGSLWSAGLRPAAALALLAAAGCARATNHLDPVEPRIAGTANRSPSYSVPEVLRIVSFNLKHGQAADRALALLRDTPQLATADIIALQEMDDAGVRTIAEGLGHHYVYYPAVTQASGRYFGNALLSRWPIEQDGKLILPVRSLITGAQRIAVRATVRIGPARVKVYSVHLASLRDVLPPDQQRQWAAVLENADTSAFPVIIAGDINGEDPGGEARHRDFVRLTTDIGGTHLGLSLDQVFVRELEPTAFRAGRVEVPPDVSDHHIVWAEVHLPPPRPRTKPRSSPRRRATRRRWTEVPNPRHPSAHLWRTRAA